MFFANHLINSTVIGMFTSNAIKEKIIIVAEHDNVDRKLIDCTLKDNGYLDIRHANTGDKVYAILKTFHHEPEKIGLIIINEKLPQCQLLDMHRNLSKESDAAAIPFVILTDPNPDSLLHRPELEESWLTYKQVLPVKPKELLMTVNFLLKLRQERLVNSAQNEALFLELSTKSANDAKLKYLVAHDELTGLFNRSSFDRQLRLALNRSQLLQKNAALIFIEVDRLCLISEWKGFDVGDRLLVELSTVMRKLAPPLSLFARTGINEFCMFLQDMTKDQALSFAENLKTIVEQHRFCLDEINHNVTISVGISSLDDAMPVDHPGKIVLFAQQACHFGKRSQKKIGSYCPQNSAIRERKIDIHWVPIIKKALRENQLFLVFQPVVELDNGAISHYEVLLRLRRDNEIILPNLFIPSAERMGLIQAVDLWVLENAIDFLANLPAHKSYVTVAVKISVSAFQYPELVNFIRGKLEFTWVDASRLILEVSETVMMEESHGVLQTMQKIRSLGCKFALKNKGVGFYPLDKIKSLPIDYIKVDGQFTKQLVSEENQQMLLKSMVEVVSKLGIKTIFVYVESSNAVLKLREIGASLAQGYTLGKPESTVLEGTAIPFSQYISERNRAEKALREKESYLRVLIDNIPFLVWLKDTQSRFLTINQLLAEQLGIKNPEAILGNTDFDFYPYERALRYQLEDQEVLASRCRKTFEEHSPDQTGLQRWTEIFLAPVLDEFGNPLGTLGFARDITERKRVEADLRVAATAFESQEGMLVTDADTIILKVNHSFSRITGYAAEEAIGRRMNLLKSEVQDAAFYAQMWEQINRIGNWQGEIWNRRKGGEIYPEWLSITAVKTDDGSVTNYVGTMIDISAHKAAEEQMRHLAHHDVLTDLPNRILLADRLRQTLAQARRENTKLALMYIDLDKFKPVNDNFGHEVGDLLLKEVALRLTACMKRESDTVSRLGGDEFVVLLANYDKEADVAMVAETILQALTQPFWIERHLINISSSIGIATYPNHGSDASSLMKNADNAMYQAKHAGRSCLKFFSD